MTDYQDIYPPIESGARRAALLICGWCNVTLAMIGAVLPGMPTTVFLIIALWAFTRSSPRLQRWLYRHPRFGKAVRDWDRHGVIPPRAKRLAALSMLISLALIAEFAGSWTLTACVGVVMALVMLFILTRPSHASAVPAAKG